MKINHVCTKPRLQHTKQKERKHQQKHFSAAEDIKENGKETTLTSRETII
jgi:hypothetical protein